MFVRGFWDRLVIGVQAGEEPSRLGGFQLKLSQKAMWPERKKKVKKGPKKITQNLDDGQLVFKIIFLVTERKFFFCILRSISSSFALKLNFLE